jgi:hypothetical protein
VGHRIECECGFAVEGSEQEVVSAAQHHAQTAHDMELAAGLILAGSRWIDDPEPR